MGLENMLFTIRPLQWEPDPTLGGEAARAPSGTISLIPLNAERTLWRWRYMSRGIFHESDTTFKTRDEAAESANQYYGGVLLLPYLDAVPITPDSEAVKAQAVRIRDLVSENVRLSRKDVYTSGGPVVVYVENGNLVVKPAPEPLQSTSSNEPAHGSPQS